MSRSVQERAARELGRWIERDAASVLLKLSEAVAAVLDGVPSSPRRAIDVMRVLSLNRKTAWQLATTGNSTDPAQIASTVPGRQGFEGFARRAEAAGAASGLVRTAIEAYSEFETLIKERAGSRIELEKMLTAVSSDKDLEQSFRRSAAIGMSYTLGVQAVAQVTICMMAPNAVNPDRLDTAMLRGYCGFEFLRSGVQWLLSPTGSLVGADMSNPGNPTGINPVSPLFPTVEGVDGSVVPLVREFCTEPLPRITTRNSERATVYYFEPNELGKQGRVDCYLATVARCSQKVYGTMDDDRFSYTRHMVLNWLSAPVEHFCFDLIVPRGLWADFDPRHEAAHRYTTGFWGSLQGTEFFDPPHIRLELNERPTLLGRATKVPSPPRVPRYKEMVDSLFGVLGWHAGDFDVYRLLMTYPPIPIISRMVFHRKPPEEAA